MAKYSSKKASFSSRFWAFVIDHIVMVTLAFGLLIMAAVLASLSGIASSYDFTILRLVTGSMALLAFSVLAVLEFLYFGWLWSKDGQTFGMKATKIKVVRRRSKVKIGFVRGALRGVTGYAISALFINLGFLWAYFDDNHEAWHDKLFDTWVVDA